MFNNEETKRIRKIKYNRFDGAINWINQKKIERRNF